MEAYPILLDMVKPITLADAIVILVGIVAVLAIIWVVYFSASSIRKIKRSLKAIRKNAEDEIIEFWLNGFNDEGMETAFYHLREIYK